MKRLCSSAALAISVALLASSARGAGEDAAVFAKANQEYAAGHYQQAIDGYESLVRSHRWNAILFYNLGNAWFRKGDPGRAILQYERALALDRQHPEAQANLRLVRDEARALELPKTLADRYLGFATPAQYMWMAALAFWVAIFALALLLLGARRSGSTMAILAGALLVFGGAVFGYYTIENGPQGRAVAIVTGKNIQARLATADNASAVLVLPAGSEVKILSKRGEWVYVALPNNLNGWIPATSVESVRL
jgi:tetratricopeptide (TPR) repeat protein